MCSPYWAVDFHIFVILKCKSAESIVDINLHLVARLYFSFKWRVLPAIYWVVKTIIVCHCSSNILKSTVWLNLSNSALAMNLPEPSLICIPICIQACSLLCNATSSPFLPVQIFGSFRPWFLCAQSLYSFPLLRTPGAFTHAWCGLTSHHFMTVCVLYCILCLDDIFTILLKSFIE